MSGAAPDRGDGPRPLTVAAPPRIGGHAPHLCPRAPRSTPIRPLRFTKVHGTGNDFVLIDDLDGVGPLDADLVRALCTPHTGLGADGVIRLAPPRAGSDADVFMDYANADGSIAEMCGNGVRCVAKWIADRSVVEGGVVRVDTRGGTKTVEVVDRDDQGCATALRVDMGVPVVGDTLDVELVLAPSQPHPAQAASGAVAIATMVPAQRVSMGNPHAVITVADVNAAPLLSYGPLLQSHEAFGAGVNVEVIAPTDDRTIDGRIYERGVGETLSSGTGASAMAVAAIVTQLLDGPEVAVDLPGGRLQIHWDGGPLHLIGPAVEVAGGRLDGAWVASVTGAEAARRAGATRHDRSGQPAEEVAVRG